MAGDSGRYDQSEGVVSLEGTLVKHFFLGLDAFQSTWMGDTGFNKQKFNMQLLYLIRILPDLSVQAKILGNWAKAKEEVEVMRQEMPGLEAEEAIAYVGMEVVTEIVMFICNAFELINEDITGPATPTQYQKAATAIPDMPDVDVKETIKAISEITSADIQI